MVTVRKHTGEISDRSDTESNALVNIFWPKNLGWLLRHKHHVTKITANQVTPRSLYYNAELRVTLSIPDRNGIKRPHYLYCEFADYTVLLGFLRARRAWRDIPTLRIETA